MSFAISVAAAAQADPSFLKKVAERQNTPQKRVNARLETRLDNRLHSRIPDTALGDIIAGQNRYAASDHTHFKGTDIPHMRPR